MNTRRSRQCRGPRARNYRRTLARANAGRPGREGVDAILAQATKSGALESHRRHQTKRLIEARRRRAEEMDA